MSRTDITLVICFAVLGFINGQNFLEPQDHQFQLFNRFGPGALPGQFNQFGGGAFGNQLGGGAFGNQLGGGAFGNQLGGGLGNPFGGLGNPFGGAFGNPFGGGGGGGFNPDADSAMTATCMGVMNDITVTATVKRRFNNQVLGFTPELEISASLAAAAAANLNLNLILTTFGAVDNTGGCTPANLGDIITPSRRFGNNIGANGVLRMLALTMGMTTTATITNLPIDTLPEAFGIGLALCSMVEELDTNNNNNFPFPFPFFFQPPRRRFRCMDATANFCCKLGRFDGNAM